MRVGIAGILHESNSFLTTPTTLADFRDVRLHRGREIIGAMAGGNHEISGNLEGLAEAGIEAVPLLYAWATPLGPVTAEALGQLLDMLWAEMDRAGKLDGLLLSPHGAAVAENEPDMDGYWLSLVRQRVGKNTPIINTIDPHANLTQRMIDACDATIAYRSNPHLDQKDRGLEAARLMARTLRGEVRPVQAAAFPPVAINIERQHTPSAPCKPMYDLADAILKRPGVLSDSIVLGFPYSDVIEMGSSFIVVTDNDRSLAQRYANELGDYLVQHRAEFKGRFVTIEEALDDALAGPGPVALFDMGDNVGGGSAADGTLLAQAILRRHQGGKKFRAFVAIYDPASAAQTRAAGVGRRVKLRVGGKTDSLHGPTLDIDATVRSLHDGPFTESQVRHGGLKAFDMGPTAVIETDGGLTIQLTSKRTIPVSLGQVTSCGLDPATFHILIAKGVQAPVAAYAPVTRRIIRVNTPGSTSADMAHFQYKHRRKPLYPLEEIG